MNPEPSTSKGATSETTAHDDVGPTTSDGVQGAVASTSGPVTTNLKKTPAFCTVCSKSFSSKKSLKVHSRKHTGEMRHRCENCGRSFWSRSAFVGHIKARDKRNGLCPRERKFEGGGFRPKEPCNCKICGKRMKYSSNFVRHMRSHRGEKPFKCGECGKAFGTSWTLTLHRRVHTGVWKYSCVFCDKGFHQKGNFWKHLRAHTEETPYFCVEDGCGKSYRVPESLKSHRRLIHLKKD